MSENLFELPESQPPQDPREFLSPAARKRIDAAMKEGYDAREQVVKRYRHDDPECELDLAAAQFNYALVVMTTVLREFKAAGFSCERLAEIMNEEIQSACYSLEIDAAGEAQIRELLNTDFGW